MGLDTLLRQHRLRVGLTQEELARQADMSARALRAIETGRVRHPRAHTLRMIADALGLDEGERAELHTVVAGGAPEEPGAPESQPAPARPAQLPLDPVHFTGRHPEIARLDRLVDPDADRRVAVSVVTGVAGVGKTALAVHWAHRVRDRFPDGQLHLDFKGYSGGVPVTAGEALGRFLRAVGVPAEGVPYDPDEAAAMYRTLLADRRMLVLLDNVVSAEQVRPLLPGGAGCRVVVTSRDRLSGLITREGGDRLTLPALSDGESLTILREPAGPRLTADPVSTAEMVKLCGGLPLALRVAAARLTDEPTLPIGAFVAELRAVLRGERGTDAEEQAAALAMFDLSYRQLGTPAQTLFRRLGLLAGADATVDVAAVLTGGSTGAAAALLDRLVGAHLVQNPAPGRYTLHDLARQHAHGLAHDLDQVAVTRCAWWYLGTADNAARVMYPHLVRPALPALPDDVTPATFGDLAAAVAWLDAERANLVAMTLRAPVGAPPVWAFADTLRGYFWLRKHLSDWLTVSTEAVSAAVAAGALRAEASSRINLGHALCSTERYVESVRENERAAELAANAGWPEGRVAALGNAGAVLMEAGRLDAAAARYAEAIEVNRKIGHFVGLSVTLFNLGVLYRGLGRLPEAQSAFEEALAVNRHVGSPTNEGRAVLGLGCIALDRGRLPEAVERLRRALTIVREVGDPLCEAFVLQSLSGAYRDLGDHPAAVAACEQARSVQVRLDGDSPLAHQIIASASIDAARGDLAAARDGYGRVLDLLPPDRQPALRVTAMVGRALAGAASEPDAAVHDAERALTVSSELGLSVLNGQAHLAFAAAALARDDPAAAAESARTALVKHERCDHLMGRVHALALLARTGDQAAAPAARSLLIGAGATRPDVVLQALPGAVGLEARRT